MEHENIFDTPKSMEQLILNYQSCKDQSIKKSLKTNIKNHLLGFLEQIQAHCENRSFDLLEDLLELIEAVHSKYDFTLIFKDELEYVIILFAQKAHFYQITGKFEKLIEVLKKIENFYKSRLFLENDLNFDCLSVQNDIFPESKQIFGPKAITHLSIALGLCQVYLQQTAAYSQINSHEKALSTAQISCELVFKIILRFSQIFDIFKSFGVYPSELIGSFQNKWIEYDTFLTYLKNAQKVFTQALDLNSKQDLLWKTTTDINLKQLFTRIQSNKNPPEVLSLINKIDSEEFQNFHISNVVKVPSFFETLKIFECKKFDETMVNRGVLILVSAIFSIATENRFVSFFEIQEEIFVTKSLLLDDKRKTCDTSLKESKLRTNKRYIMSEKIHLLALEILSFGYFDNIKLIQHFFQSYKKNYCVDIFVIEEEDEQSFSTIKTIINKKEESKQDELQNNQQGQPIKHLKISLKHDYFYDSRKRSREIISENSALASNLNTNARDNVFRFRTKESEIITKSKNQQTLKTTKDETTVENPNSNFFGGSMDSLKSLFVGEVNKRQTIKIPEASFKKKKIQSSNNLLKKNKDECFLIYRSPKNESHSVPFMIENVKANEEISTFKDLLNNRKETVPNLHLRDVKLKNRIASTSNDFLKSMQNLDSTQESRAIWKKTNLKVRKNVDKVGILSSKFSNLISESQRIFKVKYQERLKEKVNIGFQSCTLKN